MTSHIGRFLLLILGLALAGAAWRVQTLGPGLALGAVASALLLGSLLLARSAGPRALQRSLEIERARARILESLLTGDGEAFAADLQRILRRLAVATGSEAAFLCRCTGEREVEFAGWAAAPGGAAQPPEGWLAAVADLVVAAKADSSARLRLAGRPALLISVRDGAAPWGVLGLWGRRGDGHWTAPESSLLRSVARVLAAAESRRDLASETRAALERAHARDEAKSRFLANMSHEIRTPLNCIVGLSEHLGELEPTREQRQSLELIRHSSDVLLQIINDILDLSRIEAGGMVIAHENFDLRRLLTHKVGMFATRAEDKGLALDLDLPEDLPQQVQGDEARLGQIVTNLLGNAVKFTQEGGVCLSATVLEESAAGWRLRFDVTDSGIGIAPEKLERVFDSFTQSDASTTRLYGGTGLGLAISRSLAELMDGSLTAASVVDRGSVFSLELPLARAVAVESATPEGDAEEAVADSFAGCRVLVVEDDPLNQLVARKLLRSLDCEVEVAENGGVALDLVTWQEFDLILMDFMMPGMDGPQTTRELRARGGWRAEVPVVALTANALDTHRRACLDAGMDAFLTKPIRKRELARTIARLALPAGAS